MFLLKYGLEKLINSGFSEDRCENIARVTAQHNKIYNIADNTGEKIARVSGRFIHEAEKISEFPVVGDWVFLRDDIDEAVIESIVPRINQISRSSAGSKDSKSEVKEEQIIAANIDNVFIVSALDREYNLRRIERYLTIAYNSGANPFIILNKTDLCDDLDSYVADVESIAYGVPIIPVSAINESTLDEVKGFLLEGETSVLVGSSGVGKSTLINGLTGSKTQEVKEISGAVNKGVHTTTHRELFLLSNGSIVIDNPGMRELGIFDGDSIRDVFSEIEEYAEGCKFSDCNHTNEPGCAVKRALDDGKLTTERFNSYTKLKNEMHYLKEKGVKSSDAIEKEKWRDIRIQIKKHYKEKK